MDASPFHRIIDEMFDNENFDKSAHIRERYDLGATPEWMKSVGINGERFSLSFKNIKTHLGKDSDHNLTAKEWHELPSALKHPFLITSYGNKDGKFRLYTAIKVGGKFAVVGIDVVRVNQGKGVPILELNRVKTVFGRDRYVVDNGEKILAWDKNITPEQEALLRGHNYREYPTIQELSAAKVGNNSDIAKENGENIAEDSAKYRIREGERSLWQKIKATVRRLLDKFLGSLKLPKWFELGDNELRYILWRSKERLERGKEHPIDLARAIVKREELGLGEENTLYSETKKDAHPTRLQTSDDAQAVQRDAHLSGTKVEINSENREEIDKNLSSLAEKVAESQLPAEEFLAELRKSTKTESKGYAADWRQPCKAPSGYGSSA